MLRCQVCSDTKTNGYHFGAFTCEGCKVSAIIKFDCVVASHIRKLAITERERESRGFCGLCDVTPLNSHGDDDDVRIAALENKLHDLNVITRVARVLRNVCDANSTKL